MIKELVHLFTKHEKVNQLSPSINTLPPHPVLAAVASLEDYFSLPTLANLVVWAFEGSNLLHFFFLLVSWNKKGSQRLSRAGAAQWLLAIVRCMKLQSLQAVFLMFTDCYTDRLGKQKIINEGDKCSRVWGCAEGVVSSSKPFEVVCWSCPWKCLSKRRSLMLWSQ